MNFIMIKWHLVFLILNILSTSFLLVKGKTLRDGIDISSVPDFMTSRLNSQHFKSFPVDDGNSGIFHFPSPVFNRDPSEYERGWPWNLKTLAASNDEPTNGAVNSGTSIPLDSKGRVKMGVTSKLCDDAKTNLTVDWDGSPINYTCFHPETRYPEDSTLPPVLECVSLEKSYLPLHFCMNESIHYDDRIPSYGDHRPLWPKFGEYEFVPVQRWLHNIEHGAVVMLYHPCAHPVPVNRLKKILRECYGKHVITPSTLVPKERPLALVAWGCRYLMSNVDEASVKQFIKDKAMHGPEGTYTKEGQYDFKLIRLANETEGARYDRVTCQ